MTYFAELDNNDVVIRVIVSDQDFINSGKVGNPLKWIETSYNGSMRKNYAGIGYKYDRIRNVFIPPKPYGSWILNEVTCVYDPPKPVPNISTGKPYTWNELILNWVSL